MEKREFYVDTPLGKLKVWAKHEVDNPKDYPGVYIDLVRDGKPDELLACVEYDSADGTMLTCVYDAMKFGEEPAVFHRNKLEEE